MSGFCILILISVVLCEINIDIDQIILVWFLFIIECVGLGKYVFNDWCWWVDGIFNLDFVFNQVYNVGCSFLLVGCNFGCGFLCEYVLWVLIDLGLCVIVSSEIVDIFCGNVLKNGLLLIVLDEVDVQMLMQCFDDILIIDIVVCVLCMFDGCVYFFLLDGFLQICLLEGVDQLGYLLGCIFEIECYESEYVC